MRIYLRIDSPFKLGWYAYFMQIAEYMTYNWYKYTWMKTQLFYINKMPQNAFYLGRGLKN